MKELYRFREFLKEDQSLDGLKKAKPGTTVTVGKDKYVKQAEKNATMGKTNHLWWKKNKLDKLVHSKELAKLTEGKVVGRRLNESAPGYDTRKFGGALPTLESVQAAYEDKEEPRDGDHKHTYKQIDPDGTAECTKCGLRNSDPSKTGEKVRAGVRSAAEKLGMKPSHIKEEEQNTPYPFESVGDLMRYFADNNVSIIEPYLIKSINGTLEEEEENGFLTPERIGEVVEQIIKAESNR